MILLPHELFEILFGSSAGKGISSLLTLAILIGVAVAVNKLVQSNKGNGANNSSWIDKAENKNKTRFEYMNAPIIEASKERREKEERDRREAERLERYRKNQEGKPTAYEEWLRQTHPVAVYRHRWQ